MRRDGDARSCVGVCVGGGVVDVRAVSLLGLIADIKISAGRVVGVHAAGGNPR